MENLWCNLKILARVRPHERVLSRRGDLLEISRLAPLEGAWRWWAGERRHHNLSMVQAILDAAFRTTTDAHGRFVRDAPLLRRCARELTAARAGLDALLTTYEADSVSVARLTCMMEALDHHVALCDVVASGTLASATLASGSPV